MNRLWVGVVTLVLTAIPAMAQSLDDLNIQIHGYATQGFLYSTQNNLFTTSSSDGSPAWTEAVVNITSQPQPKLRIGVQARYFMLGNQGNTITLDWASADYKFNDKFGVRFGRVKVPSNLFNEIQDIDPSYVWALLPQSVYPLTDRDGLLSQYGGIAYGTLKLGTGLGKLEYRGWGGEQVIPADDGYFIGMREAGLALPNGLSGTGIGGALHWRAPLTGLMLGASDIKKQLWSSVMTGGAGGPGTMKTLPFNEWAVFGIYEKDKIMVAGEYNRLNPPITFNFPGIPGVTPMPLVVPFPVDKRQWYAMASYKVTGKLTAGIYDSQQVNKALPIGSVRDAMDWAVSGRYDFNPFLYAKAEEHFIGGTGNDVYYDTGLNSINPGGINPTTKLTILKIGVSF